MAKRFDRIDKAVGRLVFRAVGCVSAVVALVCGYAAWWHVARGLPHSLVPPLMFAAVALAAAACVPYCFSRNRTLGEALDAMEGGVGDTYRDRPKRG